MVAVEKCLPEKSGAVQRRIALHSTIVYSATTPLDCKYRTTVNKKQIFHNFFPVASALGLGLSRHTFRCVVRGEPYRM